MTRRILRASLALLCSAGLSAGATNLELDATAPFSVGVAGPTVRIGVSELEFSGSSLAFGLSHRAVELSAGRRLDLSVAGTAGARLSAGYAFVGGARLALSGNATLGAVALNVQSALWTTRQREFDPLIESSYEGASTQERGWTFDAAARYRLQRDLLLLGSGNLGQQPNLAAGLEWRQGELSLRGGARFGEGVVGAMLGATLRREDLTLSVDALVGPLPAVTGSLNYADPLSLPSSLRVYAAYELWRRHVEPWRVGAELRFEQGPGEWSADVRGTSRSVAARLGYRLPLNVEE
ncbi:hypothetical protein [Deinococcus peraridilitoris]|uniref:Uncharacterized protein n=1 Tax=Deinococcus peraridilitoris (strain DSM 19664 / LMG 22246 / CIP 109416 / KR-200) TaxID=937777 RepID=K9ZYJ1_DEIPD|nr:hypothetical protein [Deinococcus peraridilitoris]AFZ66002.1 hypothetical protein Deipe_0402 [Deinococcus peraridilitoris DSM 19664]